MKLFAFRLLWCGMFFVLALTLLLDARAGHTVDVYVDIGFLLYWVFLGVAVWRWGVGE